MIGTTAGVLCLKVKPQELNNCLVIVLYVLNLKCWDFVTFPNISHNLVLKTMEIIMAYCKIYILSGWFKLVWW